MAFLTRQGKIEKQNALTWIDAQKQQFASKIDWCAKKLGATD